MLLVVNAKKVYQSASGTMKLDGSKWRDMVRTSLGIENPMDDNPKIHPQSESEQKIPMKNLDVVHAHNGRKM